MSTNYDILDSPEDDISEDRINRINDLADGSSVFEILGEEGNQPEEVVDKGFYANLAEDIEPALLNALANELLEDIEEDLEARQEWDAKVELGMKYLGQKLQESDDLPFEGSCNAFDSTLMTSLIRAYSTARSELFPAAGPSRSQILGVPSQQIEDQAERIKLFINNYLTHMDTDYYPDSEQLLLYTIFAGSAFRKVYQDPLLNKPTPRFIKPHDFIVNPHATSIQSSNRLTHRLELTRKDIISLELKGEFLEGSLSESNDEGDDDQSSVQKTVDSQEGVNKSASENKTTLIYYESHVELEDSQLGIESSDNKESRLPKPYIVKVSKETRKIVTVRRNWEEGDKNYTRKECFVRYYYLAGFGLYGWGLAQIIGSNSIILTSILRQLIDAESFAIFPAGFKRQGSIKGDDNNKRFSPGEFKDLDTSDLPIADCVTNLPFRGASPTSLQLRNDLIQQTANLAATAENEIPEVGSNAPVGTTLAMLEVANKIQSVVLRTLRNCLGEELKLLFNLFKEYLPDEPYPFAVPGSNSVIMRSDFNESINIVPVSDPNVLTSTHRLINAECLLKLSKEAPEIHNIREVYKRMYAAMNIENVDKILLPEPVPQPFDALTENALLATGKPIIVAQFQNDEDHIVAHQQMLQDPMLQANPQAIFAMQLHIQQHKGSKALKQLIQQKQQEMIQTQQEIQSLQSSMLPVMQWGMIPPENQYLSAQIYTKNQEMATQQQQIQQAQQIPIEKILEIPEIQNMVSAMDAQEINQRIQQQQQEMQTQQAKQEEAEQRQIDPNQVALADTEQRREASLLKDEEAKLRAKTDAYGAQLKYESDMAKIEAQQNMAIDKHETDIALAQMKQEPCGGEMNEQDH